MDIDSNILDIWKEIKCTQAKERNRDQKFSQGQSATYEVFEFETNKAGDEDTVEIYFSNEEELADELKKYQHYFSDNGESCKASIAAKITSSPTSSPLSPTSSSPEHGTDTKAAPDTTSEESTSSPLTTLSLAATSEIEGTTTQAGPDTTSEESTSSPLTTLSLASTSENQGTTMKAGPDTTSVESTSSPLTTLSSAASTEIQDIDKCSEEQPCHEDANCTNYQSGYNCSCRAGFTGNGKICTDIDECSGENDCHVYSECTNFPSSYNCFCKACFTGNGTFCTDIDECLNKESCHVDANCTNFPSGYNCSCRPGFTGNGRPCKDKFQACLAAETGDETIAGCAVLEKNECNIIYEGKCFSIWKTGFQNVDLEKAKETCAMHGFHLGNIYDHCLYSHIKNQIGDVAATLWTGMTIVFGEKNHQVYLHSNKTAKFHPAWYDRFPRNDGNKHLQLFRKRKGSPPNWLYITGIINVAANTGAHGALCEKDVG